MAERSTGTFVGALARMAIVSALLCWLPVFGAFVAGYAGGRHARRIHTAIPAALVVAGLWAFLLIWRAQAPVKIGGQELTLGALAMLAPVTALALVGGALAGTGGRGMGAAGALLVGGGLIWFVPKARDVWGVIKAVQETQAKPEPAKPAALAGGGAACRENLKQLYNAVMLYADSWDGTLPPAESWMSAIKANVSDDKLLRCPDVSGGAGETFGYAINAAVGGKRISDIPDKAKTPLFFDSGNQKKDAHENAASLPKPGRHDGRSNVLYLDGSVQAVSPP